MCFEGTYKAGSAEFFLSGMLMINPLAPEFSFKF
jgi:hypothetical protein